MATLLWAAVDQFNIPVEEMVQLFLMAILVIAIIIVAAAVTVALWQLLKRALSSGGD